MHILIVEDERRLATLLRRVLTEERYTADIAFDGEAGLEMALAKPYDLLVLDLMLPKLDGLGVCHALREAGVASAVLMLTARGAVEDRVRGLNAGADDYLVKPFAMDELLARINALLRRRERGAEGASQLRVADLTLDLVRHEAQRAERVLELTAKEFSLLEFLMRHPGQTLTRSQILDHVWSYDFDSLSNVVDTYIHYLRDKIDRGHARTLITTIRGIGYRLEP